MGSRAAERQRRRWLALTGLTLTCAIVHGAAIDRLFLRHVGTGAAQVAQATVLQARILIEETVPAPAHAIAQRADAAPALARRAGEGTAAPAAVTPTPTAAADPVNEQPGFAATTVDHLPTHALDMPPMPRSAPDEQFVEAVHKSGLPIRVRLFIETDGLVSSAELLSAAPGDEEPAERVMAMFRETAFSPGRLGGHDVPSFIDVEIVLEPALPQLIPVVKQ